MDCPTWIAFVTEITDADVLALVLFLPLAIAGALVIAGASRRWSR